MRTQSIDTSPEFERVQIAHLRTFSPARKFASTRSWTHSITYANLYVGRHAAPQLSEQDASCFIMREYGNELATTFQDFIKQHPYLLTPNLDIQSALLAILTVLEHENITYALTGSLACSAYGFIRSAQDVDIIADIHPEHIPSLTASLQENFAFDEQHIAQALESSSFFSLLHMPSLFKVDILLPSDDFEQQALQKRIAVSLIEEKPSIWMLSPEDVLLTRLVWYQKTGATADDQWNDILGLLKIQSPTLSIEYLAEPALNLGVKDVLERGLIDAGIYEG